MPRLPQEISIKIALCAPHLTMGANAKLQAEGKLESCTKNKKYKKIEERRILPNVLAGRMLSKFIKPASLASPANG